MKEFSDKMIENLMRAIYDGMVTEYDLPENLYYAIANYLKKGLYDGFGETLATVEAETIDAELLAELRENIYLFSAAKTYQQVKDMSEAILDGDDIRPFREFREMAGGIFDEYNEVWLQTEYNTAIAEAQNAARWNEVEKNKKTLPLLKYSAVMDPNTSEICAPLDGTTLSVDDPFWNTFMPPNHFNCRCTVEQLTEDEGEETPRDNVGELEKEVGGQMQDLFKMNAAKDRVIFNEDHPYFDVPPEDRGFAENNFGLPIPEDD
jgi:SPP1 gp7 family putative phage head morphogenesis protein